MFKATLIAASLAFAAPVAFAQNNSDQGGLVNVSLGDVVVQEIAKNINVEVSQVPVTVQVPVDVAAAVCGVDAAVLAEQVSTGDASCEATSSSAALTEIVQQQIG